MIRITMATPIESRADVNGMCAVVFGTVTQDTPVFSEVVWQCDGHDYCVASLDVPEQTLNDLAARAQESGLALVLWLASDEDTPPRASQQTLCVLAGVESRYAIEAMGLTRAT